MPVSKSNRIFDAFHSVGLENCFMPDLILPGLWYSAGFTQSSLLQVSYLACAGPLRAQGKQEVSHKSRPRNSKVSFLPCVIFAKWKLQIIPLLWLYSCITQFTIHLQHKVFCSLFSSILLLTDFGGVAVTVF